MPIQIEPAPLASDDPAEVFRALFYALCEEVTAREAEAAKAVAS